MQIILRQEKVTKNAFRYVAVDGESPVSTVYVKNV